jgi:hypothetical protein
MTEEEFLGAQRDQTEPESRETRERREREREEFPWGPSKRHLEAS